MGAIEFAPVQPIQFWTTEMSFKTIEDFEPTSGRRAVPKCRIGTEIGGDILPDAAEPFQIRMTVDLSREDQDEPIPYEAHIVVIGHFSFINELVVDPKTRWVLAVNNGLNLVYGYARDALGDATARGLWGSFLLPAVYLRGVAEEILAKMPHEVAEDPPEAPRESPSQSHASHAVRTRPKSG